MGKLSFADYAKHRGVSPSAVSKAVKERKISCFDDGAGGRYIDPEIADREWNQNTNLALSHTGPKPREGATSSEEESAYEDATGEPASGPATDDIDDTTGKVRKIAGPRNYNAARAEREFYNAELARLKFEEQAGQLISAEQVRDDAYKAGRIVRDALLALPDRVAGEFAGETSQFKIHQRLSDEIRRALIDLKDSGDGPK